MNGNMITKLKSDNILARIHMKLILFMEQIQTLPAINGLRKMDFYGAGSQAENLGLNKGADQLWYYLIA